MIEFQRLSQDYKNCVLRLMDFYYDPKYLSLDDNNKKERALHIVGVLATKQDEIMEKAKNLASEADVAKKLEAIVVDDIKLKDILVPNLYIRWAKEFLEITSNFNKAFAGLDTIASGYNVPGFRVELQNKAGENEKIGTVKDAFLWIYQWQAPAHSIKEPLVRNVLVAFTKQEKAYLEMFTNAQKGKTPPQPGLGDGKAIETPTPQEREAKVGIRIRDFVIDLVSSIIKKILEDVVKRL